MSVGVGGLAAYIGAQFLVKHENDGGSAHPVWLDPPAMAPAHNLPCGLAAAPQPRSKFLVLPVARQHQVVGCPDHKNPSPAWALNRLARWT